MHRLGRPTRALPRPLTARRYASKLSRRVQDIRRASAVTEAESNATDFRPPWVYTTTNFLKFVMPPLIIMYSVFIHDHGDREHVFQAPRRWFLRQKAAFFALSPQEERLLQLGAEREAGVLAAQNPSQDTTIVHSGSSSA